MMEEEIKQIDWDKGGGLVPVVVQDAQNLRILMLGYMNAEALSETLKTKKVTFYSRSKNRLWVKGESSGHFLDLVSAQIDCDQDTILIKAVPNGPVCHTGTQTCFDDEQGSSVMFLDMLSSIIKQRHEERPAGSYTTQLFEEGKARIAQKVGEEAVELTIAAMGGNREDILNEAADLLFHMLVLLREASIDLDEVCQILSNRHK